MLGRCVVGDVEQGESAALVERDAPTILLGVRAHRLLHVEQEHADPVGAQGLAQVRDQLAAEPAVASSRIDGEVADEGHAGVAETTDERDPHRGRVGRSRGVAFDKDDEALVRAMVDQV